VSARREGNDLYLEMQESGVINSAALIYGQMKRAAGCAFAASASPAITVAEYFRDVEHADVLVFIDNIFRFYARRGRKSRRCSGACRAPSGYQPTLANEMGDLQGAHHVDPQRLDHVGGRPIYVPADDLTDPAPATAFAHLDATVVLSRRDHRAGDLPGGRSIGVVVTHSRCAVHWRAPLSGGRRSAAHPAALQGTARHHQHPRHGRAVRGRQGRSSSARRRLQRFMSQPFTVAQQFHRH